MFPNRPGAGRCNGSSVTAERKVRSSQPGNELAGILQRLRWPPSQSNDPKETWHGACSIAPEPRFERSMYEKSPVLHSPTGRIPPDLMA